MSEKEGRQSNYIYMYLILFVKISNSKPAPPSSQEGLGTNSQNEGYSSNG